MFLSVEYKEITWELQYFYIKFQYILQRKKQSSRGGKAVKSGVFFTAAEGLKDMIGEKRAKEIDRKARHQREMLLGVSSTAPINVQVRFRLYCLLWELKQKYYENDIPLPYVTRWSYEEDLERILYWERRIITGGSDEERARKAVKEAKEYLNIVAEARIRDTKKNRVF